MAQRKPTKTTETRNQGPEPDQIKALERLLRGGDFAQASKRARLLVGRFPDHAGVNRLLLEALLRGGNAAAATLAAYEWATRRPNSPGAQEALYHQALMGNHFLLAAKAAARMGELGVRVDKALNDPELVNEILVMPDGTRTTRETMERFEIAKLHLEAHDFAGAQRLFAGLAITPARNNRLVALFHLGRAAEALNQAIEAWDRDPDNLFALGWASQLRLYLGDETGARGLTVPLAQAEARRLEDAQAQMGVLLLLGENQPAWAAFERSNHSPWREDGASQMEAMRQLFGGGAASRLGREDEARTWWKSALNLDPALARARENLAALNREGSLSPYPALFDLTQVLPLDLINGLRELSPQSILERMKELDIGNDYLRAIYLAGDTIVRGFAAQFLKSRLDRQAPDRGATSPTQAAAILRELALLPIGTHEERLGFLQALKERDLVGPEETLQLWDQGKLSEIRFFSSEISREPVPSGLPDDLQELLDQSIEDLNANRVPQAEAALTAILARIPDHPIALGNLGAIYARQGRIEECQSHLRQVIAVHPDYLFARANLAALLIEDGELDEAKALLDGLMQRPRLYIQEYFALYGVLAMLSRARGDEKGAARLMRTLEQVVETKEEERLLAQAKARLEKVGAPGHLSPTVRNLMKNLESLMGRKNR